MVQWRRMTVEISGYAYGGLVRVERSTYVSMRRFLKFFSVQRGTLRESYTASRREEACLLNLCFVVAQWVTSQSVTVDMTVTFLFTHRRLRPKSDQREKIVILVHSALYCPFLSSSFPSTSCTPSCTLSSTT